MNYLCILHVFFLLIVLCECKLYHNYTLYRYQPTDEEHLLFFQELGTKYDVNFWRGPVSLKAPIDFVIGPSHKKQFLIDAYKKGIHVNEVIENVQRAFDDQVADYSTYVRRNMKTFNWKQYSRLDDIYVWMRDLELKYPNDLKIKTIAQTNEGRELNVAVISVGGSRKKPKVIIEGGVHAREWIAPAFVTYLMNQILNPSLSDNLDLKMVANHYEFHIVPVLNPDGYEYSHTKDRMWRKNRRGVDINRNFGLAFSNTKVTDHDDEEYGGPKAFSEKESHALATYLRSIGGKTKYYLAFHSYGLLMILPYCYTKEHIIEDFDKQAALCKEVATAISARRGSNYTTGTAFDQVGYTATGVSSDWAKKALNIPYVMTFEMNDNGKYGFALPASEIKPVCLETLDGVVLLLKKGITKSKNEKRLMNSSQSDTYLNVVLNLFLSLVLVNVQR